MDQTRARQVRLSPRQLDVLTGYAEGKKRKQIAEELDMSLSGVSVRTTEFKQRLGTTDIEQSIHEARRLGLIEG